MIASIFLLNWHLYHNRGYISRCIVGKEEWPAVVSKKGLRMGTKKGGRALPSRHKRATHILKSHSLMVAMVLFRSSLFCSSSHIIFFMHNPCQMCVTIEYIDNK